MENQDALLLRLTDVVQLLAAETADLLGDYANRDRGRTAQLRQRAVALHAAAESLRQLAQSGGNTEHPREGQS